MPGSVASSAGKDNTGEGNDGLVSRTRCSALALRPGHEKASSPLGSILLVLLLDRIPRLGPVVVAPVAELVEIAAHGERLCAVHGDGLAGDPVAAAGNQ